MLNTVRTQLAGTDCNGHTYHCINDQQFQLCEDLPDGRSQTVDDKVYSCPPNLFCDNAGQSECDSRTRSTPSTSVTSSSSTTTTTTAAQSSTTNSPSSTTSTTDAPFTCTHPGRFLNTTDCHRYYACTLLPNSGLRQTNYTCLYGMAFSPAMQRCTTDQSSCYPTFTCKSAGRFADPSDSRSYFWCLKSGSSYTLYHLSCAFGQPFDPAKGRCSGWIGVKQADGEERAGRMAFPGRGGYN